MKVSSAKLEKLRSGQCAVISLCFPAQLSDHKNENQLGWYTMPDDCKILEKSIEMSELDPLYSGPVDH